MSYRNVSHKIWMIPLEAQALTVAGIAGGIGGGFFSTGMITPLVYVTQMKGKLEARNKDLNPIGLKRNIRQNFGANSKKYTITGYISPLGETTAGIDSTSRTGSLAKTIASTKLLTLKNSLLHQTKFIIVGNNDFDIITIDSLEDSENEDEPFVYDVSITATSLRVYDNFPSYLASLATDIGLNTLMSNILPTVVFKEIENTG